MHWLCSLGGRFLSGVVVVVVVVVTRSSVFSTAVLVLFLLKSALVSGIAPITITVVIFAAIACSR